MIFKLLRQTSIIQWQAADIQVVHYQKHALPMVAAKGLVPSRFQANLQSLLRLFLFSAVIQLFG